jgi:transcriptional regulator with AAA-type ATPase domain/tetratricopeptide (TPR) repeat protein
MLHELLGTSAPLAAVREQLARLTTRQATPRRLPAVLIQGETGTGKGLIAQLIHKHGPRAGASFVDVNCAAIPETLLEAELFGFEQGAFTDARHAKPGLLQVAHRGTIFLDEIGLMPASLQAKLLKVLEDRAVRRLGGTRNEPADAWVVAATSEDLPLAIRAKRFRQDLYHRLAVVTVHLPPLRARGSDIVLLARHFLSRVCTEYGVPPRTLTADAERALTAYTWPGNVRELANVMERVALLASAATVDAGDLGLPGSAAIPEATTPAAEPVDSEIDVLERTRIEEALHATGWNISRAAARLGLARNTLRYRMERHRLVDAPSAPRRKRPAAVPSSQNVDETRPEVAPIGTGAPVLWQRTRVTLLHVDLAYPEHVADHERSRLAERLAGKAASFGGRVIALEEHEMTAVFGLDVVEDAPQHATHAALAMLHAARGHDPTSSGDIRIAIAADETLVGRLDGRVELNLDGRRALEQRIAHLRAAAPGEPIVVSADLRPFLQRRFRLEPAGTTDAADRPWTVAGLADARREGAPLVARAAELMLLQELLQRVLDGEGQSVLIAGEPGIGKTRLLRELRDRSPGTAAWLAGSAVSFGAALPFHPLIDLLKGALGIQAGDTHETIAARIERETAVLGDEVRGTTPFLRGLLCAGAEDADQMRVDPKLRRAGIFDAVRQYLAALARTRPLVIVLEDIHWADAATAEFLPLLVEGAASARILLCATVRPGFALPVAEGAFTTRLTLRRVPESAAAAIGAALLGGTRLDPSLQHLIESHSEGNPFFIEEFVRSLRERDLLERDDDEVRLKTPADSIDVPGTVHDVIRGRLERLAPATRELLHLAAVVGREFSRRVLDDVWADSASSIDTHLEALRSADLITRTRVFPEETHAFRHALIHDVAYHSQSDGQRQTTHARIGDALARIHAGRTSDHDGVLAHHYMHAHRWDTALAHLFPAARQAERSFAIREALALYDQAQHAAEQLSSGVGDPATMIAIHEARARLFFVTSDFERSASEGERILPLARLMGDRVKESQALATIAWASTWGRNLDAAIRFAREALAVAEPAGALAVQGRAHFTIGFVRGVTGELDESQQAIDRTLVLSREADDPVHLSLALSTAGLLKNWTGDFGEAATLQEEGLALARERGLLVPLLLNCFLRGLTLTGKGDYDEAFAACTEGLSLAERVGDEAIHHRLLNCLGWLHADLGDLEQAETFNAQSAQIGRRRRDPGTQPNAELNLAEIYMARGDLRTAQELYDGVYRYYRNPSASEWMRFRYAIRMFAGMGELALARGNLATARAHLAQCLELATRTASRKNLVKALRLEAGIACADRDTDRAEARLQHAREIAHSLGNPVQRWKTDLALADLLESRGRAIEARQLRTATGRIIDDVRDRLRDERLRKACKLQPSPELR